MKKTAINLVCDNLHDNGFALNMSEKVCEGFSSYYLTDIWERVSLEGWGLDAGFPIVIDEIVKSVNKLSK